MSHWELFWFVIGCVVILNAITVIGVLIGYAVQHVLEKQRRRKFAEHIKSVSISRTIK